MTIAIFSVLVFSVVQVGGTGAVLDNARALPGYLALDASYVEATGDSEPYSLLHILTTVSWCLGYLGMPHFLLRFMAIEDENKLTLSRRVASVWVTISMALVEVIGIAGCAMSAKGLLPLLHASDTETVIVQIAAFLSRFGILPALLAGLVLSGILASTMSTADSQLLAASSSVSQNLLQEAMELKLSPKAAMLAARGTVIVIAILGVVFARAPESSVSGIVSFAWAGFGATFGPVMLFALFWKRSNKYGAISGMVAGGIMVFVWKFLVRPMGGVLGIYELLPAFIVASIFIVIVSLLTPAPEKEIVDEFESIKNY